MKNILQKKFKTSDALKELCWDIAMLNGLNVETMDYDGIYNLVNFGILGWNLSYVSEDDLESTLNELESDYKTKLPSGDVQFALDLIRDATEARKTLYPNVYREIQNFELHEENDDFRLRVYSIDLLPEAKDSRE